MRGIPPQIENAPPPPENLNSMGSSATEDAPPRGSFPEVSPFLDTHKRLGPNTSDSHVAQGEDGSNNNDDGTTFLASILHEVTAAGFESNGGIPASFEQRTAHEEFQRACHMHFSVSERNWNEEFQHLYDTEVSRMHGFDERGNAEAVLAEFESRCEEVVKSFIDADSEEEKSSLGFRPLEGTRSCYLQGNLFLKVWTHKKLAQNMMRSFLALVGPRVPFLHIPLMSCFTWFDVGITVQALVPLALNPMMYPVDRPCKFESRWVMRQHNGLKADKNVMYLVRWLFEALNFSPVEMQYQVKQGFKLVLALDSRFYVVNPFGVCPPVVLDNPAGNSSPLHSNTCDVPRTEFYRRKKKSSPAFHFRSNSMAEGVQVRIDGRDSPGLGKNEIRPLIRNFQIYGTEYQRRFTRRTLLQLAEEVYKVLHEPVHRRHEWLIQLMHNPKYGLGVCMLGKLTHFLARQDEAREGETRQAAVLMICAAEMIARTLRRMFYEHLSAEQLQRDLDTANTLMLRAVGSLLEFDEHRFETGLLPHLQETFALTFRELSDLRPLLESVVMNPEWHVSITRRLAVLCGFVMNRGMVEAVKCLPSNPLSRMLDPQKEISYFGALEESEALDCYYSVEYVRSFVLSWRYVAYYRRRWMERALDKCKDAVSYLSHTMGQTPQYYMALFDTTFLLAQAGYDEASFRTMERSLSVIDSISKNDGWHNSVFYVTLCMRAQVLAGVLHMQFKQYPKSINALQSSLSLYHTMPLEYTDFALARCIVPLMWLLEISGIQPRLLPVTSLLPTVHATACRMPPASLAITLLDALASNLMNAQRHADAAHVLLAAARLGLVLFDWYSKTCSAILNKLAVVCLRWAPTKLEQEIHILLVKALAISLRTTGFFSIDHLSTIYNLASMFICLQRYARASLILRGILEQRSRWRLPTRFHPIEGMLTGLQKQVKTYFEEEAGRILVTFWRQSYNRLSVQRVQERAGLRLQRVGRGMLVRHMFANGDVLGANQLDVRYNALNFSEALLKATFDPRYRNWNAEYQAARARLLLMPSGDICTPGDVQRCFYDEVRAIIQQLCKAEENDKEEFGSYRLPNSAAFQVRNVVISRWMPKALLPQKQREIFRRLEFFLLLSVPLVSVQVVENRMYFAQAVIPFSRCRSFIYRHGVYGTQSLIGHKSMIEELHSFQETPFLEGIELIRARDDVYYAVNLLGLCSFPTNALGRGLFKLREITKDVPEDLLVDCHATFPDEEHPIDASSSFQKDVSHLLSRAPEAGSAATMWSLALSESSSSGYSSVQSKRSKLLQYTPRTRLFQFFYESARLVAQQKDATSSLESMQTIFESIDSTPGTIFALVMRGVNALDLGRLSSAIPHFERAFRLLIRRSAHPYFVSDRLLMLATTLHHCYDANEESIPVDLIDLVLQVANRAAPNTLLFEVCTSYTRHCTTHKHWSRAEAFAEVQERSTKMLDQTTGMRYATAILEHCDILYTRGGTKNFRVCDTYLRTAIQLVRRLQPDSLQLCFLLHNYGKLQKRLNHFRVARLSFMEAGQLCESQKANFPPEPVTEFLRSNRRSLKLLDGLVQNNAAARIQRTFRVWRMRQHQPLDDAGLASRWRLRLKRLLAAEGSGRLIIMTREDEAMVLLKKKWLKMLGSAKMLIFYRATRSDRPTIWDQMHEGKRDSFIQLEMHTRHCFWTLESQLRFVTIRYLLLWKCRMARLAIARSQNYERRYIALAYCDASETERRYVVERIYGQTMMRALTGMESVHRWDIQQASLRELAHFVADNPLLLAAVGRSKDNGPRRSSKLSPSSRANGMPGSASLHATGSSRLTFVGPSNSTHLSSFVMTCKRDLPSPMTFSPNLVGRAPSLNSVMGGKLHAGALPRSSHDPITPSSVNVLDQRSLSQSTPKAPLSRSVPEDEDNSFTPREGSGTDAVPMSLPEQRRTHFADVDITLNLSFGDASDVLCMDD